MPAGTAFPGSSGPGHRATPFPSQPMIDLSLQQYLRRKTLPRAGGKESIMANTKSVADKAERKKIKRTARKKAAPKAKRTTPRGSLKKKVKKLVRGQSKR